MDAKAIGDAVGSTVTFVLSNPPSMLAVGLATAHLDKIIHATLLGVYKVPLLRALVFGNPQEAKAKLTALVNEVNADIDEIAAAHAAATSAPAPAADKPAA